MKVISAVVLIAALGVAHPVFAHNKAAHAKSAATVKKEQKDWGVAGEVRAVKRTIKVNMLDTMRFNPDKITVKLGETVRIRVKNTGAMLHEFVIGTKAENTAHAALMLKFPDMEHDEPYMAHVPVGKTVDLIWTFNKLGDFEFACLIAGHYQSGMVGTISVTK
jgi:uncharacterized cupredoxin-like copper-binding protein